MSDPIKIPTFSTSFANICELSVQVGTNCPQGGDSGHGGRTVLKFFNDTSVDMMSRIGNGEWTNVDNVEIQFGGDAECTCLIMALEFAARILRMQSKCVDSSAATETETIKKLTATE